jgi:hypothetical protein
MKKYLATAISVILFNSCGVLADNSHYQKIAVAEYQDKVKASWLGQIIGNTYGLSYEFKFIDQPGPNKFPYGFGEYLAKVKEVNGAFSDDDTDIEYMYLLQMEKHGSTPSYSVLADAWQYHVREKVWVANRQAVALMHAGYSPPLTGHKTLNPQWFQIDPQLVNEIWAVTAPGMIDYAAAKTRWAGRITSDDFGLDPAVMYGAMFSAAFFERDIVRLIEAGLAALPAQSRFAAIVRHMQQLHKQYPNDWQKARAVMAEHYYRAFDYNKNSWLVVDANLNGACAILALLYGGGDFQKTLDMASAMGFDADNQAASMSGLLGIVGGTAILPKNLLFPIPELKWSQPYNDRYINVSRVDLPDARISDLVARMANEGEKIILAQGGKKIVEDGVEYYLINPRAKFAAPLELPDTPVLFAEQGQMFSFNTGIDVSTSNEKLTLLSGALPPGLHLQSGVISGVPQTPALYRFKLRLSSGKKTVEHEYVINVHTKNLAPVANEVLHNLTGAENSGQLNQVLRDGNIETTYYSAENSAVSKQDFYGYRWEQAQNISVLRFNPGTPKEFSGWFTSLRVQYLDNSGAWQDVQQLQIVPAINFDNSQWLKGIGINHTLSFVPVITNAIRIIGAAGGVERDHFNGGGREFYTAISELSVHQR